MADTTWIRQLLLITTEVCLVSGVVNQVNGSSSPQSVFVDSKSANVLGSNGTFRNSSSAEFFNPSSITPPFFQIFDSRFLDILGVHATFNTVTSSRSVLISAHEAPIYVQETDELFFVELDPSGNVYNKINMTEIETALSDANGTVVNVSATPLSFPDSVQGINGSAGIYNSSLAFVTNGVGILPPSVVLVNPIPPYNATVLLDNFFGRQFNSLDDVKIHTISKAFFFTDVSYVNSTLYPHPRRRFADLRAQIRVYFGNATCAMYRFDTSTGSVRVVAADFQKCNGIAFSEDGKTAYVTNIGLITGINITDQTLTFVADQTLTATIYQFDVDAKSQMFLNRRVFAYVDTGIPDGIQLDASGNVYAGCGDGVNIWFPDGTLLGTFFTGETVANMAFAGDGRLVLLGGTGIYLAKIAAKGQNLVF